MRRLSLRQVMDGELQIWELRQEGREYIIGCDPSLGRVWSEGADSSCISVWKRCRGKVIEQVAEWTARWPAGRVGEVIACLGRYYGGGTDEDGREFGNAVVNIERNLMDLPKHTLVETQGYPEEFLFVPLENRQVMPGMPKVYFTNKSASTQQRLLNTLIDYMDRGALLLRSRTTLEELRTLEKDRRGHVNTNGKDRSVAVIMACMIDHESTAIMETAGPRVEVPYDPPPGIDPVTYRQMHGLKKPREQSDDAWWERTMRPF